MFVAMPSRCLALFAAFAIGPGGALDAQPARTAAAQPGRSLGADAMQQDFDVLTRALEEAHGGYDRFVAKPELARRIAAHRTRLNRELMQLEFAGILSETLAELRDGHARLEFDSVTAAALTAAPVLPLRVALEDERLIVRYNDSPTDSSIRPGMDVAAQLRSMKRAVFIGEETAGTYEGNTSGLNALIVLPNSGLRLRIMMYGYWNAVEARPGGRGIIPEHVVPTRIADLLAGRDAALDLVRSLSR